MSYKNLTELPFEEYFKHINTLNERQKRELRSDRIAEGYGKTPEKEERPYYELLKCPVKDNDKIYRLFSNTNTESTETTTSTEKEENILDSIKSRQMQSNGIIKWRYYKTIMWKDTKYRNLSEGALSLLNYLRTSPNSNGIGMFAESIGDIATNTNVNNVLKITQRLEELKDNGFVRYINNHIVLTTFLDEQQKITKVSIIKNLIEEYNKLSDDVKLPYYPSLPTDSNEAVINSYNTLYDGIHALGQIESENGYTTEYLSIWTEEEIQSIIDGIRCQSDIRDNYNVYGEAVKSNIPTPKVEEEEITPLLNESPQIEERSTQQQEETPIAITLDEVKEVAEIIAEEPKQPTEDVSANIQKLIAEVSPNHQTTKKTYSKNEAMYFIIDNTNWDETEVANDKVTITMIHTLLNSEGGEADAITYLQSMDSPLGIAKADDVMITDTIIVDIIMKALGASANFRNVIEHNLNNESFSRVKSYVKEKGWSSDLNVVYSYSVDAINQLKKNQVQQPQQPKPVEQPKEEVKPVEKRIDDILDTKQPAETPQPIVVEETAPKEVTEDEFLSQITEVETEFSDDTIELVEEEEEEPEFKEETEQQRMKRIQTLQNNIREDFAARSIYITSEMENLIVELTNRDGMTFDEAHEEVLEFWNSQTNNDIDERIRKSEALLKAKVEEDERLNKVNRDTLEGTDLIIYDWYQKYGPDLIDNDAKALLNELGFDTEESVKLNIVRKFAGKLAISVTEGIKFFNEIIATGKHNSITNND